VTAYLSVATFSESHPLTFLSRRLSSSTPFADGFADLRIAKDLAKLSKSVYSIENGVSPNEDIPSNFVARHYIDNSEPDTEALVATSNNYGGNDNFIAIVFRGSESSSDWATNFNAGFVTLDNQDAPSNVKVHQGFRDAVFQNDLANSLDRHVQSLLDDSSSFGGLNADVYLTGHSLGGALAQVMGAYLANKYSDRNFRVITFGQPKVGNDKFKDWSENELTNLSVWRFVNRSDAVPRLPPGVLGYDHAGHTLQINRKDSEAFYRHVGGVKDYRGVSAAWTGYGTSIYHHSSSQYINFFEKKAMKSKYWPQAFEKECPWWKFWGC